MFSVTKQQKKNDRMGSCVDTFGNQLFAQFDSVIPTTTGGEGESIDRGAGSIDSRFMNT